MYRVSARLVLAVAIAANIAGRSSADEEEVDPFVEDTSLTAEFIIRGQSPAPTQLRVAQGMSPTPDVYYTPGATNICPPGGSVCLPPMDPYQGAQCGNPCSWQPFHFGLFGEFIYLQARNADVPFAVPQDGIVLPGSVPTGAAGVADPGYAPGFRVGGYFAMGPEARVIATWTWFSSTTDTTISTGAPSVINPLVLFPGTFNAGFTAQEASSGYDVEFQFIDIDYQVVADACNTYWWGYSGGARYARLVQDFNAFFPFAPPDGATSLTTSATFEGVGPRAGLEGERVLFPSYGLRAYGKSSASFLVGKFQTSYLQTNQFNGTEANTSLKQDRIVPILDFELGLAWVSPREHMRISAGYLVQAWFNSITSESWIESVQNRGYDPGASTLTFDGLSARGEVRF